MTASPPSPNPDIAPALPPVPWGRVLLVMAIAIAAAHALDGWALSTLRDPRVNDRDWGRLLRSAGYVPTWLFGSAALWLHGGRQVEPFPRHRLRHAAMALLVAPLFAGAVAEGIKLVLRRLRPAADSAAYQFRPFTEDLWSTRGLGMASSHTAVAFGGAVVLARVFPGTRWVWYVLATGCAATRVLAGAHFLSDTVAAAAIGWLAGELIWRWRRQPG